MPDPARSDEQPTRRERIMSIIQSDLGAGDDDDLDYLKDMPSPPREAATEEPATVSDPPSPPEPTPPVPAPSYDFAAEAREQRALVAQMVAQQQERDRFEREQWQQRQLELQARVPQPDPEEFIQRNHLTPYEQQLRQMDQGLRYVVQQTQELHQANVVNEFNSAAARFYNNPEYPDFEKYVPKAVLDNAINSARNEIRNGKTFNPGQINWQSMIDQEYRLNAYHDLVQERKTRAAEEAKRAEVNQKLAEVGGTPRGGTFQSPSKDPASKGPRLGEHGFRNRVHDFVKGLGFND